MFFAGMPLRSRRVWVWTVLVLVLTIAASLFVWQRQAGPPAVAPVDMVEVLHANNRGVGSAESFQWPNAVTAFEEVVRMAPDWLPGRINLGIALLNNSEASGALQRARSIFAEILQKDPENPYAHFCLGIIMRYEGNPEEAAAAATHFKAVTNVDPNDAAAWYWYGSSLQERSEEQDNCYKRALQLNPNLSGPLYGLAMNLRLRDPRTSAELLKEFAALRDAEALDTAQIKYTEMGRYAEVIGRVPESVSGVRTGPIPVFVPSDALKVQLAAGARWAGAADFGKDAVAELRRDLRNRFGGVIVVLDYNRDGKPDLLLLGAVVEAGKVRDLLLRNDGDDRFTDVTAEAGLAGSRHSLGCCVADYDNDGYPDLCITGIGEQRLFRNTGQGKFEDVTAKAGLDQLKTVCLGAAFVDLDQDGDLDLVIAQYATLEDAERQAQSAERSALRAPRSPAAGGLAVFLNIGEALPISDTSFKRTAGCKPLATPSPALGTKFVRTNEPVALLGEAVPAVSLAVGDLDLDRDLDLLVLADRRPATVVVNDRLLRFHRTALPETLVPRGTWNGGLLLDVNHDRRSDLFLVGPAQRPLLLINSSGSAPADPGKWFQAGTTNSPPLLQAQAIDIDLDGWTDVVGLSAERKPVLLHNVGGRLEEARESLGSDAAWPKDLIGVVSADMNGDGFPDLVVWSEGNGLRLHVNQGNGNHGLKLELSGHRRTDGGGNKLRCNADGFGTWIVAQASDVWTAAENTTLAAGLGQSSQPLLLGLGRHSQADVLRLRWPDNTWQAEFNIPTEQLACIEETNRKTGSCPVLFAWNGRRFGFVTDFLGAGSMGEMQAGGGHRPPRPEESVKIEPDQLLPLDGSYVLKIAEPMDEATYLDRLQLRVLDHPSDMRVYPDERFSTDESVPSQDLLAFREEIFPVRAADHRGRDVTHTLRAWDRKTVDDFAQRSWLGYAEEHWVELDFGDRLAKFDPKEPLILCLAGWTEYPYPEAIWAATQAGVALQAPVLERLGADGKWQSLTPAVGFPAGLPRMMTVAVTGKLAGPRCLLRLRTNMEVYWDQIFVAPVAQSIPSEARSAERRAQGNQRSALRAPRSNAGVRVTPLEVESASLASRGLLREYSPDGRAPYLYDYDRLESVPFSQLAGRLTRLGEVTELLRDRDDRFVIFGPGDELTIRFDAGSLPVLPSGWTRSFVLKTWGYCKDCGPFTATGATIEPLPFQAMSAYPYGPDEHYPEDAAHEQYRKQFNTRSVGMDARASEQRWPAPDRIRARP
jgi:tetratricopeptide (TPR) repeat protein